MRLSHLICFTGIALCFMLFSNSAVAQPWSYYSPSELYADPVYLKVAIGTNNPSDNYRFHVYGGDSGHGSALNGIYSVAEAGFTAVHGRASSGKAIYGYASTGQGVYGYTYSGTGVYGKTTIGTAVYGTSGSNGWAGFFNGKAHVSEKLSVGTQNTPTTIGGANISAYHLFVAGGILTEELRVRTAWADYVFEDEYKLSPLSEIAKYIDANGHLPNVPSASTVEEQGLELGDITRIQQEKIEELYLYMIEMEKHILQLESEVELMRNEK